MSCAIFNFGNTHCNTKDREVGVIYHRFPNDPDISKQWVNKCYRKDEINIKNAHICSEHFLPNDYQDDMKNQLLGLPLKRVLNKSAVPSQNLPNECMLSQNSALRADRSRNRAVRVSALERLKQLSPRKKQARFIEDFDSSIECETEPNEELPNLIICKDFERKVVVIETLQNEVASLKLQLKSLKIRNKILVGTKLRKYNCHKRLNSTIKLLKSEICILKKRKTIKHQALTKWAKKTMTPGQIKLIETNKQVRWTSEDISRCVVMRALSPKSYDYWREKLKFPLPSATTLRRWCAKFTCFPGILRNVLCLLKKRFEELSDFDKLCVINFDEMHIDSSVVYDSAMDKILGPSSKVQVLLVRGLISNWKQHVYFEFDTSNYKKLLMKIIQAVESSGLLVTSIVSDMGGSNFLSLWSSLQISVNKTSFVHPNDSGRQIFVFADMPHYFKLLRNHFLDSGLVLGNGTEMDSSILRDVLEKDCGEIKLCHKLNPAFLTVKGNDRQKVGPAKAVFSRTTAKAIALLIGNYQAANFFELMDNFYDIMNSRSPNADPAHPLKVAFGVPEHAEEQYLILNQVEYVVSRMRVKGKPGMLPFQKGMLVSITSLRDMFAHLQARYSIKYIITTRLTQDALESLFGQLRGLGRFHDHPSPSDVISRLKTLMISNKMPISSRKTNITPTDDKFYEVPAYLTSDLLKMAFTTEEIGSMQSSHTESNADRNFSEEDIFSVDLDEANELDELSALLDDAEVEEPTFECNPVAPHKSAISNFKTSLLDFDIFEKEHETSDTALTKLPSLSEAFGKKSEKNKFVNSEIHQGDTDSSDDEDNKYVSEQNYNESGGNIKHLIKKQSSPTIGDPNKTSRSSSWKSNKPRPMFAPSDALTSGSKPARDVYTDPYFGIRIINPLISSSNLKEKMQGKTAVNFSGLEKHIANSDKSTDWVIAGVIVSKSLKTSQKGHKYVSWSLSDLKEELKTVNVLLFGKAYHALWKTSSHVVVAILNPTPLDSNKSSNDIAALSVSNADQVLIWGQSKDMGTCKARKKNGDPCSMIVNMSRCDFCIYHVKQEYRKFTNRSELQAPSGGSLAQLRNKVLGKNEVFYAGKTFTAKIGKPATKQVAKDQKRLSQLFNQSKSSFGSILQTERVTKSVQSARVLLMKDAERLQKLTGSPATLTSLAQGSKDGSELQSKKPVLSSKLPNINKNQITKTNLERKEMVSVKVPTTALRHNISSAEVSKSNMISTPAITQEIPNSKTYKNLIKKSDTEKERVSKKGSKASNHQISSTETSKPNKICKGQPSKNRFENLVKLNSNTNKVCETSSQQKSKPTFDISFEFEDSTTSSKSLFQRSPKIGSKNNFKEDPLKKSISAGNISPLTNRQHNDKYVDIKSGGIGGGKYDCESKITVSDVHVPPVKKTVVTQPTKGRFDSDDTKFCFEKENVIDDCQSKVTKTMIPTDASLEKLCENRKTNNNMSFKPKDSVSAAKARALRYVKSKGPISKNDLKEQKSPQELLREANDKKRKRTDIEEKSADGEKSVLSQRFLELMNATSKHTGLIEQAQDREVEDYFDKMEKKESLENKMLTTYKIECKAVRCLKCNYKWFSASDQCKADNHPIKVISAVKRFFQCQSCKRRTVTLEIIPLHNCRNCGQGNWIRAPMMRERQSSNVRLSIRGGEQTFTNSVVTDANLDLLVPDN